MSSRPRHPSHALPAVLASLCAGLLLAVPALGRTQPASLAAGEPTVVINEILAHSDSPYVDAVELHNLGSDAVDLSGWLLTDDDRRPQSEWVRIPAGAVVETGSYYVIADTEQEWQFGLSEAGDAVYLFRPDPQGGMPQQVDAVRFGASPRNVSLIRYVDSVNRVHFPIQDSVPTLGIVNCDVRVSPVQIEELMVDPASGKSEYIIIANVGGRSELLYDPENPTNSWKLIGQNSSGNDNDMFFFPQGTILEAGERIIVSEVAPDLFRQDNNIPASARIFGPLNSGLSSTGERVALAMPLEPELDAKINYILVDEVEYSNQPPWPSVEENGQALRRISPTRYGNDVANWRAAPALQTIRQAGVAGSTIFVDDLYLPFVGVPYCTFN